VTILLNYHISRIVLGSMCVGVSVWLGWSGIRVAGSQPATRIPHLNSNTHRTKNNTTNVIIQQYSCKLLMMDILMSKTCWAHKKWNRIANDVKLVFYSSNITGFCVSISYCPLLFLFGHSFPCLVWGNCFCFHIDQRLFNVTLWMAFTKSISVFQLL